MVGVGGADEAGGVLQLGDAHAGAVDAVALQPGPVVREVLAGGSDQDRSLPEVGHAEGDVGGDTPAADLEVLDQEGHRNLLELLLQQAVGEPTLVGHQVVGGNGSGESDTHRVSLPWGTDDPKYYRSVDVPLAAHGPYARSGARHRVTRQYGIPARAARRACASTHRPRWHPAPSTG